nr:MAG TPA: hypothetical protein [Inoviridae sp.]
MTLAHPKTLGQRGGVFFYPTPCHVANAGRRGRAPQNPRDPTPYCFKNRTIRGLAS